MRRPETVNRRLAGAEVAERHGAARYATAAILRAEAAILDAASARGDPGMGHPTSTSVIQRSLGASAS